LIFLANTSLKFIFPTAALLALPHQIIIKPKVAATMPSRDIVI
jgi:hypothetical protein